jgi:hydrogenase-4 component E
MSDLLIILFGATILTLFAASRIEAFVRVLALQGLLLFLLVLIDLHAINLLNVGFLVLETLVVKTIVIPLFLLRVIRRNEIGREVEPHRPQFFRLLLAGAVFLFGFVAAFWAAETGPIAQPLYFGMSIAMMIASLFLIVQRRRIIIHILAFITLENGIFLLSIAVAHEMPMLINLGVLLDLFVGVFLLGIFFNTIQSLYDRGSIDDLSKLKD